MAKGDHKRAQDMIYDYSGQSQNMLQDTNNRLGSTQQQVSSNYVPAVQQNKQDYNNIMGDYQSFFNNPRNPQPAYGSSSPYGMRQPQPYGQSQMGPSINDPMGQFETALRTYQTQNPDAAKSTDANAISQYMKSQGINVSPYMYGDQMSGNEVVAPNGEKYKFRVDNGGWYNSSMDDGGGGSGTNSFGFTQFPQALSGALSGYQDFANNGGFSDQDIQDIRARNIAPIRSIYGNAMNDLATQRNVASYMPNYGAARSKMARQMSQQIGDMNENTNADIAAMRNSGRLAGLSGLSGLGTWGGGLGLQSDLANQASRQAALGGMTSLYGATPGMSSMFGNQMNQANENLISGNNAFTNAGSTYGNQMINSSNIPGNFQSALGNIGSAVNFGASMIPVVGQAASIFR